MCDELNKKKNMTERIIEWLVVLVVVATPPTFISFWTLFNISVKY